MAFEGGWLEIVGAGILEKPNCVIFCHTQTKANFDAQLKKSTRKFKPGEAVPGITKDTGRPASSNAALGAEYDPLNAAAGVSYAGVAAMITNDLPETRSERTHPSVVIEPTYEQRSPEPSAPETSSSNDTSSPNAD